MKQAVIVAGGDMDVSFGKNYIGKQKPDLLIAADSGMEFFYQAGLVPDVAIGDFDSVGVDTLDFFRSREEIVWVELIPEKDDTDAEAAIRYALKEKCKIIHFLGAVGNRLDHVLGNIHLLGLGFEKEAEIIMTDPWNRIRLVRKGLSLHREEQYGHYVSLLPFTPVVKGITLKGMKYPLRDYTYHCFSSIGISNEIVEDVAEISFEEGLLLVMESKDKPV